MKKLMVVLAAVAMAAVSQAAQVQWNVTGIAKDPASTAYNGYTLYLCDASKYTASVLAADLAKGDFTKLATEGFVTATSGTVQQGTAEYAKIAATYKGGDFTVGTTYDLYTLVLNGDTSGASKATYFTISKDISAVTPSSGFLAMTFSNLSSNSPNAAWTATATPEPTSGLLLLIGMAGLALRRRRA